jgi:glutamine cyclotransferase
VRWLIASLLFLSLLLLAALPFLLRASSPPPVYGFRVVRSFPHDPKAFTQGLIYDKGLFYESTGLNGASSLREVEPETGKVRRILSLDAQYFAEGLTLWRDRLIQLTWRSHKGLVYDKRTFRMIREFRYNTEGWGLTHDKRNLILSDGTATLYFLDPDTFRPVRALNVTDQGEPVTNLNELEFIKGEIYANVWQTPRIARISPRTGKVRAWIDLSGLPLPEDTSDSIDVLNGIAYDPKTDRLFVTGKLWPRIYQIELTKQ